MSLRHAGTSSSIEVELEHWGDKGMTAPLATRERSDLAGFHWEQLNPGKTGAVPHCHSAEEEIFVILEGTATPPPAL